MCVSRALDLKADELDEAVSALMAVNLWRREEAEAHLSTMRSLRKQMQVEAWRLEG